VSRLRESPKNPPIWKGRRARALPPKPALDPHKIGFSAAQITAAAASETSVIIASVNELSQEIAAQEKIAGSMVRDGGAARPYVPPFPESFKHPTKFPSLPRKEHRKKLIGAEHFVHPGASKARLAMMRSAVERNLEKAEGERLVRHIGVIPPDLMFAASALSMGRLLPLAEAAAALSEKEQGICGHAEPPGERHRGRHMLHLRERRGVLQEESEGTKLRQTIKNLPSGVIEALKPPRTQLPVTDATRPKPIAPPQPLITSITIHQDSPYQRALKKPLVPLLLLPQKSNFRRG